MQRDKGHLLDILEAAEIALTYVRGMCRDDFLDDLQCQDAVIRRLEIIGEAAPAGHQVKPRIRFPICRGAI